MDWLKLAQAADSRDESHLLGGAFVAPASCRLSRGHLAIAVRAGRPHDSRRGGGDTKKPLQFLTRFP